MRCETCRDSSLPGWIECRQPADDMTAGYVPCPDCIGGVASCCDAAGSAQPEPPPRDGDG